MEGRSGDSSTWSNWILTSPLLGDNKTMDIDQLDNEVLLMNCIEWLTEVPSTDTGFPFPIDPIWLVVIAGVIGLVLVVAFMKKRSSGGSKPKRKKTSKKK